MDYFSNLTQMLAINHAAHAYFSGLPSSIRQKIAAQRENIHSLDELLRYAEILKKQIP